MFTTVLTTVVLVGYVLAAQVSADCKTVLMKVAVDPGVSACLAPTALIPALTGSQNTSFIPTFGTWVNNMCSASPCSDATISSVVKNITTACASDGGISSALLENLQNAQFVYPIARKIMCLQDSGKSCVTETLSNFFANTAWSANVSDSSVGSLIASAGTFIQKLGALDEQSHRQIGNNSSTLTRRRRFGARSFNDSEARNVDSAGFHHDNLSRQTTNFLSIPANMTCTTCIKSAATLLDTDYPGAMAALFPSVRSICGVNFQTDDTSRLGPAKAVANHASAFRGIPLVAIFSMFVSILILV